MERVRFPIEGVTYHTDAEAEIHRGSGAWVWSTFGEELRSAAREVPETEFIITREGSLTFQSVDQQSESLAASLLTIGLNPGDRALFQFGSVKEIVVALFGCFKANVVPVCTLPQYREIEIGQLAKLSGARAYFVQADFSTTFDQAHFARQMMTTGDSHLELLIVSRGAANTGEYQLEDLACRNAPSAARERTRLSAPLPGDVAMFQLSGGSTGIPKIIPRMHAEYLGSCAAWNRRQRLTSDDISLWALPLIHNAGMIMMLVPSLLHRRPLVLQAQFEINEFLGAIARHKVTYTGSVGPIAPRIIDHPAIGQFDLSSLRLFFALSRADGVEQRTGIPSLQMYGITEGMLMTSFPEDSKEAHHRTVGWPIGIGDETRLFEPGTNSEVPLGKTGEFCFRGPHTLRAYFNAPDLTADSFTPDGFFRTGDLMRSVMLDGRLHYMFEGRLKDNINRGGEKFGAEEVETLIAQHPDVNDARVVSMPDTFLGERACCFLIPKSGHRAPTVASLGAFLQSRGLAKFKLPERVEIVSEFPVTRVGKTDKNALRRAIADRLKAEATNKSKRAR